MTGTPRSAQAFAYLRATSVAPGFSSPIELRIPEGVSAMRRFGLKPAARRLAMRRVESVLQLDREVGGLAVRVGLAGRRFGDPRAVELGELDEVLFLLRLGRLFERLFDRAAHVDRTLDL